MSIASAIAAAQGRVADCYTAISNKGGTLPATQNLSNMPTAIASIPSGGTIDSLTITPTTSQQTITASGGVDGYSPITVNAVTASIDNNIVAGNIKNGVTILGVTGTMQSGYTEFPNYQVSSGVASRRSGALTGTEFSNITSIDSNGLYYAFYNRSELTGSLDLSSVTSIGISGLQYAFAGCTGLTSVDLSSLTSVGNYGLSRSFNQCSGITSVDLSSLTSVGNYGLQYAFYQCKGLTSVDLSSLTSVSSSGLYYAFLDCIKLTGVFYLSSLTSVGNAGLQYAFADCAKLTDIYFNSLTTTSFGSYTNQFVNMLYGTGSSITHTLHFPSNLETTIQGLTGYPNFGGASVAVVLSFDLPATS